MTIPQFGRVTPAQIYMLRLIGFTVSRLEATLDVSDAERMNNMRQAREKLQKMTGRDFGYDLQAWHTLLCSNEDYGYTHPYGFDGVKQAIESAVSDPERQRIVSLLENE